VRQEDHSPRQVSCCCDQGRSSLNTAFNDNGLREVTQSHIDRRSVLYADVNKVGHNAAHVRPGQARGPPHGLPLVP
jgi:hypothetical protein